MANANGITLDNYLSNFSKNRLIDKAVKLWFTSKNGNGYCLKPVKEWDNIIGDFFSETEIKTR